MKIQTPTLLTILSIILLCFLIFFNLKKVNENKKYEKQIDSLNRERDILIVQKRVLEKENDSLTRINDSLIFKDPITIYNETKYKYGKEIKLLDSSNINKYLDVLSR